MELIFTEGLVKNLSSHSVLRVGDVCLYRGGPPGLRQGLLVQHARHRGLLLRASRSDCRGAS